MISFALLVIVSLFAQLASSQPNSDIIDLCETQQWTQCNKTYRTCQMKVNASPCPCFRQLLECGAATGCITDQERRATIIACEVLCVPGDCAAASSLWSSSAALLMMALSLLATAAL
jgi:hypothetical protein